MIRCTTPTIIILFPSDANEYDDIIVTFNQQNITVFEKHKTDMTINKDADRNIFSGVFILSQEETALFDARFVVSVQVKVLSNNICFASKIYSVSVDDILNEEVMGDGI